jgi:hypothetical protein
MTPQAWTVMSNSKREPERVARDLVALALIPLAIHSGVTSEVRAMRASSKDLEASMTYSRSLSSSSQ